MDPLRSHDAQRRSVRGPDQGTHGPPSRASHGGSGMRDGPHPPLGGRHPLLASSHGYGERSRHPDGGSMGPGSYPYGSMGGGPHYGSTGPRRLAAGFDSRFARRAEPFMAPSFGRELLRPRLGDIGRTDRSGWVSQRELEAMIMASRRPPPGPIMLGGHCPDCVPHTSHGHGRRGMGRESLGHGGHPSMRESPGGREQHSRGGMGHSMAGAGGREGSMRQSNAAGGANGGGRGGSAMMNGALPNDDNLDGPS